jgi:hypothetical protein
MSTAVDVAMSGVARKDRPSATGNRPVVWLTSLVESQAQPKWNAARRHPATGNLYLMLEPSYDFLTHQGYVV